MIRPVLIEVSLFLAPFAAYALFLLATRARVLDPVHWPLRRLLTLAIMAMVLMIGSFFFLARSSAPPGAIYEPARIDESGRLVPGRIR